MTVRELSNICYDNVFIYTDDGNLHFTDLYKGDKNNIPTDLLDLTVKCFGAFEWRLLAIDVIKDG